MSVSSTGTVAVKPPRFALAAEVEREAVLAEACRLLAVPVPEAVAAVTVAPKRRAELRQALEDSLATVTGPAARGAWLAALFDSLWHDGKSGEAPSTRRKGRRAFGEHYTPAPLARELTEACLRPLLTAVRSREELAALRVLEPAAGAGAFLCAIVDVCAARFAALEGPAVSPEAAALQVLATGVVTGLERDPLAAAVARRVLALAAGLPRTPATWALLAERVRAADALAPREGGVAPSGFDAVVTNPPFLFSRDIAAVQRAQFAQAFELTRDGGQWDLYWLFAEAALTRWLAGGGAARLGLLLPEAVLARDETHRLRRFLLERVSQLEIRPLGVCFAGVQTGIIALTATRRGGNASYADADGICAIHRQSTPESRGEECVTVPLATLCATPHARFVAPSTGGAFVDVATTTLGDVLRIRRGEEVGKRSLRRATEAGPCPRDHVPVLTGESLAVPLAPPRPSHWMPVEFAKKPAQLFQPPRVLVAKTGREVHAALEPHGWRALQSVYMLRLTADAPAWLTHELLCALLVAEVTQQRWIRPVTASKRVFPQITQSMLKLMPLPPAPPRSLAKRLRATVVAAGTDAVTAKLRIDKLVAEWLG